MVDLFRVPRESRSGSIGERREPVRGARPVLRAVDLPALLARDDGPAGSWLCESWSNGGRVTLSSVHR